MPNYHLLSTLLLTRLEDSFGIHGSILEWIKSYLTDRSQFVRFGSASAAITNCTCGVPQGSVLGPLLFVVYISPMANLVAQFGVEHQQYADDTQLYVSLSKTDLSICVTNLHCCLTVLYQWFDQSEGPCNQPR